MSLILWKSSGEGWGGGKAAPRLAMPGGARVAVAGPSNALVALVLAKDGVLTTCSHYTRLSSAATPRGASIPSPSPDAAGSRTLRPARCTTSPWTPWSRPVPPSLLRSANPTLYQLPPSPAQRRTHQHGVDLGQVGTVPLPRKARRQLPVALVVGGGERAGEPLALAVAARGPGERHRRAAHGGLHAREEGRERRDDLWRGVGVRRGGVRGWGSGASVRRTCCALGVAHGGVRCGPGSGSSASGVVRAGPTGQATPSTSWVVVRRERAERMCSGRHNLLTRSKPSWLESLALQP